jgi:2-hydroxy-3-oxopropionate reductase
MSKVGFIGLGIMGAPMAGHLLAAGHELYVDGRHSVSPALLKQGAVRCDSGKQIAGHADVIIIMVPDRKSVV